MRSSVTKLAAKLSGVSGRGARVVLGLVDGLRGSQCGVIAKKKGQYLRYVFLILLRLDGRKNLSIFIGVGVVLMMKMLKKTDC